MTSGDHPTGTDRTVLVIGGAGYVGSVLVARLLRAGYRVRVLDQLIYDNGFAIAPLLGDDRLTFVRGDLRDPATLGRAAAGAQDVVLLAALVGDPVCRRYPELAHQVNRVGARTVVDALDDHGVERFVFTSTCSNYGVQDPALPATETSALNPQSLYARTKIDIEEYVPAAGLSCAPTVLRIATAYGLSPRMRFDLTVSQFVRDLASGIPLQVYDADTWRPYCHVDDIGRAVQTVLRAPVERVRGEVFNVGDDAQQFTKRMIVDEALRHVDGARVEYRDGDTDPRNYRVSFAKIAERLGYVTTRTVQDYVPTLVAAVRSGVFDGVDRVSTANDVVRHLPDLAVV